MGCYATRAPDEVAALPGVSQVVTDKRELPDLLGRFGVTDIPTGISGFGRRHRAYVKVQDGCMLRCSFCIIPYVRPSSASRPVEHILDEVRRLVDRGYREVVLTGIHLGHYGVDWNRNCAEGRDWMRLSHLVRRIAELPGDFRVRLSSIEATEVTRELIDVMADQPDKVAPHLHISMQSGSDTVLRRMRRRWGSQRFIDRCRLVQERLDRPAITTDIIVGFPGETDARVSGDDRRGPRRRLLENPHLPVQSPPRHAGRRHAEPSAEARAAGAVARIGGRRSRTCATHYYRSLHRPHNLRVLVETRAQHMAGLCRSRSAQHVVTPAVRA